MKKQSSGHTLTLKQTFVGLDEETLNTLRQVAQRCTYPPADDPLPSGRD